jgi:hypothetical protein
MPKVRVIPHQMPNNRPHSDANERLGNGVRCSRRRVPGPRKTRQLSSDLEREVQSNAQRVHQMGRPDCVTALTDRIRKRRSALALKTLGFWGALMPLWLNS